MLKKPYELFSQVGSNKYYTLIMANGELVQKFIATETIHTTKEGKLFPMDKEFTQGLKLLEINPLVEYLFMRFMEINQIDVKKIEGLEDDVDSHETIYSIPNWKDVQKDFMDFYAQTVPLNQRFYKFHSTLPIAKELEKKDKTLMAWHKTGSKSKILYYVQSDQFGTLRIYKSYLIDNHHQYTDIYTFNKPILEDYFSHCGVDLDEM